jgi:hypothetical protein
MLHSIGSFYKDNDESIFAKTFFNESTGFYEVHYFDGSIKEDPPVGLFKFYVDAASAAEVWTT